METKVYTAAEVQEALSLGKTKTYQFLNEVYHQKKPLFKVIKVGNSVRVLKSSFDRWLDTTAE